MSPSPSTRMKKRIGLGRMDAAIDSMERLGFPRDVARRNVNKLLKVYNGPEGFVFIEEGSYKLLIETILEEQENPPEEGEIGAIEEGEPSSASPASEVPSNVKVQPSNDAERGVVQGADVLCASGYPPKPPGYPPKPPGFIHLKDSQTPTEVKKEEISLDDALPDTHPSGTQMDERVINESSNDPFADSLTLAHIKAMAARKAEDPQVKRSRRRCQGWISNDEDLEAVCLVPALCATEVSQRRRRRSRWDVGPENV